MLKWHLSFYIFWNPRL